MLDRQRSFFSRTVENPLATGYSISAEGRCLVGSLESGELVVQESTGEAGDTSKTFEGVSISNSLTPSAYPHVETAVVPSSSPYTITLTYNNLVASAIRVVASTTGALTEGDHYTVVDSTGVITVDCATYAALKGQTLTIWYRFQPTVALAKQLFYEANVNAGAAAEWSRVGCGQGPGQFYTTEYDPTVDWTGSVTIKSGANGAFVNGGSGLDLSSFLKVIHAPDTDNPYLGLAWK